MFAVMQRDGIVERSARGWILRKRIPELPPSEEGSKRQKAIDFLLAELGSGRLRPGDQISELALANKIGVATVSMREALLEMMPLGLLTKRERNETRPKGNEVGVFGAKVFQHDQGIGSGYIVFLAPPFSLRARLLCARNRWIPVNPDEGKSKPYP